MRKASGSSRKSALSPSPSVGVLLGGTSPERKISLKSGRAVAKALREAGFRVRSIDPGRVSRRGILAKPFDVAFIALHGSGGEDGTIQKWLDQKKVPYTGSNERGCRLSFDKILSKRVFVREGIPTPEFVTAGIKDWEKKLSGFPVPFFVKPPCDGSSIGVYRVDCFETSRKKIAESVRRYRMLLVEKAVTGREFTVGVFGGQALPVIELRPKSAFYDFKSKYTKGMTDYLVPAPITAGLAKRLQRLGLAVHKALGLRDYSRVDIMVDSRGRPYVLEANSIPGFTAFSLLPKAARHAGIEFDELCSRLVFWAYGRSINK